MFHVNLEIFIMFSIRYSAQNENRFWMDGLLNLNNKVEKIFYTTAYQFLTISDCPNF